MADLGTDPDILRHVLTGFAGWWDNGGLSMTAGAGLAGIGALAMAAAQSFKSIKPARPAQPLSRRARIKSLSALYAEPLTSAAVDLLWRFKEIIADRSGHYLAPNTPGGAYFTYKRQSTAYVWRRCSAGCGRSTAR